MSPEVDCPYTWCSAKFVPTPTGKDPQNVWEIEGASISTLYPFLVPSHTIVHPILTGPCPASLMHYPVMPKSLEAKHLNDAAQRDHDRVDEQLDKELRSPVGELPTSKSLRNRRRIGREPPPRSKDWQLKGRADEDVQPDAKFHEAPPGVQGQGVGKVSIQETAAALQGAAIKLGEARAELADLGGRIQAAIAAVQEGRQAVQAAKGDVASETLNGYISLCLGAEDAMNKAFAELEDVPSQLGAALELGEQYSNAIHS